VKREPLSKSDFRKKTRFACRKHRILPSLKGKKKERKEKEERKKRKMRNL